MLANLLNSSYAIVKAHEKIDNDSIITNFPDGIAINDWEYAEGSNEKGELTNYVCCINNEHNVYFLGNSILIDILKKAEKLGVVDDVKGEKVLFTIEKVKSASKREYHKWTAVDPK